MNTYESLGDILKGKTVYPSHQVNDIMSCVEQIRASEAFIMQPFPMVPFTAQQ